VDAYLTKYVPQAARNLRGPFVVRTASSVNHHDDGNRWAELLMTATCILAGAWQARQLQSAARSATASGASRRVGEAPDVRAPRGACQVFSSRCKTLRKTPAERKKPDSAGPRAPRTFDLRTSSAASGAKAGAFARGLALTK
jgi:hypothetical protein